MEINQEKVHIILKEALRVKGNRELVEEIRSFYIFIKEDIRWKIKFSSTMLFLFNVTYVLLNIDVVLN